MAGAESLIDRILEEARQQARINLEHARSEADAIIGEAKEAAGKKGAQITENARREAGERRGRLISTAELEGRKKVLQAKQEMVEEAFKIALEKLNAVPDTQYESTLIDMIAGAMPGGEAEIILSSRDRERLSRGFAGAVNQRLAQSGCTGSVRLSEEVRNINGGFILKCGSVEINNSFEAIVRMLRSELEAEVVKILFDSKE
jgi:V/A-type H+-transporting ATPase subunit E